MFLCYDLSTALRRWEQHEHHKNIIQALKIHRKMNKNAPPKFIEIIKILKILKILKIHIEIIELTQSEIPKYPLKNWLIFVGKSRLSML